MESSSTTALLPLMLTFFFFSSSVFISGKVDTNFAATSFIRSKCRSTTYPSLCVQTLSSYATVINRNPKQLAQTALYVSLKSAQSTKDFVNKLNKFKGLKPKEYAALKDCLEEASDSVDRLGKSVAELKNINRVNGKQLLWHISNVETWVSASLTDDTTCVDGFAGRALDGRIKGSIKARMTTVSHVTSNALALIHQLAPP